MTRADFVENFQKNGEFETKAATELALKAFLKTIEEGLVKKETISFLGFGTFSTVEVPEKSGKIPNSDKMYTKEAHTAAKFKFGKTLKDSVANS